MTENNDKSLERVESQLRQQPLHEPSNEFDQRMEDLFKRATQSNRECPPHQDQQLAPVARLVWQRWGAAAAALAACAAIAFIVVDNWNDSAGQQTNQTETVASNDDQSATRLDDAPGQTNDGSAIEEMQLAESKPVRIEQVWSQATPGEVIVSDTAAMRPVLVAEVQQTRWIDEKNNVEIELTVPRQQVVMVTVAMQ